MLVALIDFGGVAEVAAALKLSPATVRTHLRHVFEKTGVRRQADLVKLMASYPAPILTRRRRAQRPNRALPAVRSRQFVPTPASRRILP